MPIFAIIRPFALDLGNQVALDTCRNKAEKDYRDCTLVVAIEPTTPIMSFHAKHQQQLAQITTGMTQIKFKAKRVFLVLLPDRVLAVHQ